MDVASEKRVDVALKAGTASETVNVSAETLPQVETTSAELGGTLDVNSDRDPSGKRPGLPEADLSESRRRGFSDQISDSPGSYGTFSMNGSRGRSNNFLLDGTDMNDGYRNDPP